MTVADGGPPPRVAVLYSGGRDSTLAALLLAGPYRVTLVTGSFGVTDDWRHARRAARAVGADAGGGGGDGSGFEPGDAGSSDPGDDGDGSDGDGGDADGDAHLGPPVAAGPFRFRRLALDRSALARAADRTVADGHPRAALASLHEHALERVAAAGFPAVADGTRRDDRTPTVDRPTAQSIEDRHGVDYLAPLAGFGHGAVADLVDRCLRVETGPSERVGRGDYEAELRATLADRPDAGGDPFPPHEQSRAVGLRAPGRRLVVARRR